MSKLDHTALISLSTLKLYLKFEETSGVSLADSSGNGNTGTASRTNILNNRFGYWGYKGVFSSASSDKVTIADSTSLKPTGSFSIGAWVRYLGTPSTNHSIIQSYSNNTNVAGIQLAMQNSGQVYVISGRNTGSSVGTDWRDVGGIAATSITDGKWHHVVGVGDGATLKIYFDGKLADSTTWAYNPGYATTNYVRIGCTNNSGTDVGFWDGDIDEVFLFNNKALSQVEVNALYIRGIAPSLASTPIASDTNLKLYAKFDETSGASVADSSGNSHTGTASAASILNNDFGMVGFRGAFVAANSDKVTFTDHTDLKPTGVFSIGAWYRTATTGTSKTIFQSYANSGGTIAGIHIFIAGDNKMYFASGKNTGVIGGTDYGQATPVSSSTCDGRWHQVVCVWDGTTLRTYLDGMLDCSVSWGNAPVYRATNYIRVGCQNDSGPDINSWDGDIDEVFLLNGTALLSPQIAQLYNGNQGTPVTSSSENGNSNLKLLYQFEETSGTTLTDSSGNSHSGTASAASILNNNYGRFLGKRGVLASANSNKITITDHTDLKPTTNFSVGGWFRTSSLPNGRIFFQSNSLNSNYAGIFLQSNGGAPQIISGKNTGTTQNTDWKQCAASTVITDGKWHHIAATWDGSNLRIYIDGYVENTVAWVNAPAYAASNYVRLGCETDSGTDANFVDLDIDEFFIFNGKALSSDEVWELYRINDVSPSASLSPSSSSSASVSPSSSSSRSISPSASISSSSSISSSVSASISPSSSFSPSSSTSPSPSIGYTMYSRGNYSILPINNNDLESLYTAQEENIVSEDDGIRVGQSGVLEYMIHEFKTFIATKNFCQLEWNGQSTISPQSSTVYFQIYNQVTNTWDTLDQNSTAKADQDFRFLVTIPDLTNYKGLNKVITTRIYQRSF